MPVNNLGDFCWLDQLQSEDRAEFGDKACYLGLLRQQGYPVITGFAIAASVFQRFLATIRWSEPLFSDFPDSSLHLDIDDSCQLQAIAQRIQQAIQETPLWDDWLNELETQARLLQGTTLILRPSIALIPGLDQTASSRVKGLLSAQMCLPERPALAQGLRQVWKELFQAKSLFYWQRAGIALDQVRLGVLVQPVWEAIASGDAELRGSTLELRALWGLGTGLTTGEAAPDLYQIDLAHHQIRAQQMGSKGYAYHLTMEARSSVPAPPEQYLQGYANPEASQQYALQREQILQVANLSQQIAATWGSSLTLEWMVPQPSDESLAELYLTQISFPSVKLPSMSAYSVAATSSKPVHLEAGHLEAGHLETVPQGSSLSSPVDSIPVMTGLAAAPGRVIAPIWVLQDDEASSAPDGVVIVTDSLAPAWANRLGAIAGIVTEQGGMTSHAAILAREWSIPAVVGVTAATQYLKTGAVVCVDGDRGTIYSIMDGAHFAAEPSNIASLQSLQTSSLPYSPAQIEAQPEPYSLEFAHKLTQSNLETELIPSQAIAPKHQLRPSLSTTTRLMLNLGHPTNLETLAHLPVAGVGLLRSEHLLADILTQRAAPLNQLEPSVLMSYLTQRLHPIASAFAPRPVFYRTLDLRGREFRIPRDGQAIHPEDNSILGAHGVLGDRLNPALLDAQLMALRQLQLAGCSNIRLLLPFVRTVEEFQFCRARVVQAGLDQAPDFQLWIMAEVPSVLFLLPELVEAGVQGISIGSNDLTQLLLAIDRDYPAMAELYDESNLAVQRAIHALIKAAQRAGISCSICGEAPAGHPEMIATLVKWGISAISVASPAVEQTQEAIARAERELLLEATRKTPNGPLD